MSNEDFGNSEDENIRSKDEVAWALEQGFTPGRWWQAIDMDGNLQAETSDPSEFEGLGLTGRDDIAFYHQFLRTDVEWVRTDLPRKE